MAILVTGGAGFIGSNFVSYILDSFKDSRIVCVDALTYAGNLENLKDYIEDERLKFIKCDISNNQAVRHVFRDNKVDSVINFAAETHVDRSIESPNVFVLTNVLGTQNLLEACIEFSVNRYHQVSTDEVYGDLPLDRPDLLFLETNILKPSYPYSATKAGADLLALTYFRMHGLKVTISRCSNNYGPRQFPEKLIPLTISRALEGQSIPVYGTGLNIRDWIYVKDHCSALDNILRNGKAGEIYNIGADNERTNLEVVNTILKYLDKPESLKKHVTDRKAHDLRYALDTTKIRTKLGWSTKMPFDEGIVKTMEWYKENRSWWENIVSGEYNNYYERMYGGR